MTPAGRTSRKTRRPRAEPGAPTRSMDRDAADDAAAWFEEASDHVQRRAPFDRLRLGPVSPVPIARLLPGRIAWSRSVSQLDDDRPTRSAGRGGPASLYYAILPALDVRTGSDDMESPLVDVAWAEFSYAEPVRGAPRAVLMIHGGDKATARRLRPFADVVRDELESESD